MRKEQILFTLNDRRRATECSVVQNSYWNFPPNTREFHNSIFLYELKIRLVFHRQLELGGIVESNDWERGKNLRYQIWNQEAGGVPI